MHHTLIMTANVRGAGRHGFPGTHRVVLLYVLTCLQTHTDSISER